MTEMTKKEIMEYLRINSISYSPSEKKDDLLKKIEDHKSKGFVTGAPVKKVVTVEKNPYANIHMEGRSYITLIDGLHFATVALAVEHNKELLGLK